jgi:FtsH-binding integral membrane protein
MLGRTTGGAARIGTGLVAPRASSRNVPPGTTTTATPPRASAERIATCRIRGICSGVLISSQYTLHSRNSSCGWVSWKYSPPISSAGMCAAMASTGTLLRLASNRPLIRCRLPGPQLGAWLGRNLTGGVGIVVFILAFACLIAMRFTARRSTELTVGLLAAFGLLIGLAVAPTIAYYGSMDPRALWEAGGATALFIAGFGAAGYATRRDLAPLARVLFWALLALIVFGLVLVFVNIPGGDLVYSVLGLVIFAGFTMFDFQRLRTNTDINSAPFLAASIFLDVLNVFLFFLEIFSGGRER